MKQFSFSMLLIFCTVVLFGGLSLQAQSAEPFSIKIDPPAATNPVKTQHTFVATVYDKDGNPLPGQRVEWILSRGKDLVGDIVEHDDMGAIVGSFKIQKISNHYSVSYTNEQKVLLTMGTDTPNDDVVVGVGQTWVTITSPVEGKTHVIAFCPAIKNKDKHKAFAVKNWLDLLITWPENAVNRVGEPHKFRIKIVKASNSAPQPGYKVKWEIKKDETAPDVYFGKEPGTTRAQTETDESGVAQVTLNQAKHAEGANHIKIELCNPEGELLSVYTVTKQWKAPSIEIAKTGPAKGVLGENFDFELNLSNKGNTEAKKVVVKDTLPEGLTYVDANPKPTDVKENEITWEVGVLPKDASRKMTITAKPTKEGKLTNLAQVFSEEAPPKSSTATIEIGAPQVYILKEGPKEIRKGQIANYKIVIKNKGNAAAQNVVVKDRIPPGMRCQGKDEGMYLVWNVGTLNPNQEYTIPYSTEGIKTGSYKNVAQAFVKDKVVHTADWTTNVVAPTLEITKVGPRLVFLHKGVSYKITIENKGDGSAQDVTVIDTIPAEMDYISSNPAGIFKGREKPATVTWKFPEIKAGSKLEIELTLHGKITGRCKNVVKMFSSTDPLLQTPITAEAQTQIMGVPAMHISSYDTEDPCEVGSQTIYVIEVRNEGTSPCTSVKLVGKIPEEMEFVSAEGPTPYKLEAGTVYFEDVAIVQPAGRLVYKIVCKAVKAGSAKNTATLRFAQFEKEIIDEEGTSVFK